MLPHPHDHDPRSYSAEYWTALSSGYIISRCSYQAYQHRPPLRDCPRQPDRPTWSDNASIVAHPRIAELSGCAPCPHMGSVGRDLLTRGVPRSCDRPRPRRASRHMCQTVLARVLSCVYRNRPWAMLYPACSAICMCVLHARAWARQCWACMTAEGRQPKSPGGRGAVAGPWGRILRHATQSRGQSRVNQLSSSSFPDDADSDYGSRRQGLDRQQASCTASYQVRTRRKRQALAGQLVTCND